MRIPLGEVINAVGRIIFPPRCFLCDELLEQEEWGVHGSCRAQLMVVQEPVCMHCGRPVAAEHVEYCSDCRRLYALQNRWKDTYIQGKSMYLYKGEIKKSMYRFKYSNRREYAKAWAEELVQQYGEWIARVNPQVIVPVPMYDKKQKKRGYNQAVVLAQALASKTGIPTEEHLVLRVRNTVPQKELDDVARKNNLKNAFQIVESIVKYKRVLVIDDIYTTGSTADAITECLHQAGVSEVYFISICIGKGAGV